MKKGDSAGVPIYREPGRRMPQEEVGWVFLMACGVDLLSHTDRRRRSGGIEGIHAIRFQYGGIVAPKRVSLGPGEILMVRANRRHHIRLAYEAGHGEGAEIASTKAYLLTAVVSPDLRSESESDSLAA